MTNSQPQVTPARLREFFNPRSVALIGVSDRNDMSVQVHRNMLMHDFAGQAFYVNPARPQVHGRPTVPSISAIGEPVDLGFVFLGGDRVVDVVEEAAANGIRNLVVLSGGFKESGQDGKAREARIVEIAAQHDQVILGPNTIGYINLPGRAVFYGSANAAPIKPGPVGVAVQSGVLLALSVNGLPQRGAGLSVLAAVANESVISLDNMIDFFVEDEQTKVISLFMETTRDPENFRRAARRALAAGKPIVALASARTPVTVDTAVSHTGALVGDQRVKEAALEELGVIMVRSLEELFATTALLANYGPLTGRRVAFTSVSGGLCELFADRAIEAGLQMPDFTEETKDELTTILPSFGSAHNPLDYTGVGQTDPEMLPRTLKIITQDPNIDLVVYGDFVATGEPADPSPLLELNRVIGEVAAESPIPVLAAGATFTDPHPFNAHLAETTGKPFEIGGLEHGPYAIERSVWWSERRAEHLASPPAVPPASVIHPLRDGERSWAEHQTLGLLQDAGVPVVPWALCSSANEAAAAAEKFGFPVVVKVSSPDIAHKSAIGGVVLNVPDATAARAAHDSVTTAARAAHPEARLGGSLVMPMRLHALELIVGVVRDRTWGPVVAVGLGGVWAETLADTVVATAPASAARLEVLLRRLRGAALFDGGHGIPPTDLGAVARGIQGITELAVSLGEDLESIEVNPIGVTGDLVEALDGLLVWRTGR